MKIGNKLIVGFLAIASLVGFAGFFSAISHNNIQTNSEIITKVIELDNLLDKSLVKLLSLIQAENVENFDRDKLGYEQVRAEFDSSFKRLNNEYAKQLSDLGFDTDIFREDAGELARISNSLIASHKRFLAKKKTSEEKMNLERQLRHKIRDALFALQDDALTRDVYVMQYKSKEALYQYKDREHGVEWLGSISKVKDNSSIATSQDASKDLNAYERIAQDLCTIVVEQGTNENQERLIFGVLKELMERSEENQERIVNKIKAESRALAGNTHSIVSAVIAGAFLVSIISGLTIARSISKPVSDLVQNTQSIARGDFSVRVDVATADEIGGLASSFNKMAEDLQKTTTSVDNLNQEIAERQRAEGQLRKSRELLEQRVTERTVELVEANAQLRQAQSELVQSEKMSMLGQLVAGVAHEINTPTGAIMNVTADSAEHLRELATAAMKVLGLPPEIRQWLTETIPHVLAQETVAGDIYDFNSSREIERELWRQGITEYQRIAEVMAACGLKASDPLALRSLTEEPVLVFLERLTSLKASSEICHTSVRKIIRIVKALRYYSRSGEGEMFDIDVTESIDSTLIILQNRIKYIAGVERNYQDHLPTIRCGSDISQVWTNIISNACDAIEGSGGKGAGLIRITTSVEGEDLVVEVFNEGPPIPEDLMTRVFDPFVTTKPIGEGTGLGLSICTGILSKYDGRIEARNDAGGVAFRVSLPLAQRDTVGATRSTEKTAEPVTAQVGCEGGRQ